MKRILGILGATLTFGVLLVTSASPASADRGFADALSCLEQLRSRSITQTFDLRRAEVEHQVNSRVSESRVS
jgi:hypothetical protein